MCWLGPGLGGEAAQVVVVVAVVGTAVRVCVCVCVLRGRVADECGGRVVIEGQRI